MNMLAWGRNEGRVLGKLRRFVVKRCNKKGKGHSNGRINYAAESSVGETVDNAGADISGTHEGGGETPMQDAQRSDPEN